MWRLLSKVLQCASLNHCDFRSFSFSRALCLSLCPGEALCQPSWDRLWPSPPSSIPTDAVYSKCFLQALPYAFILSCEKAAYVSYHAASGTYIPSGLHCPLIISRLIVIK